MRLFYALLRRKHMPNGHIYRGKDRLYKEVTPLHVSQLKKELAVEERNMYLLTHPYLTTDESKGHAKELGKHEARMHRLITQPKDFREHVTLESILGSLRFGESWD